MTQVGWWAFPGRWVALAVVLGIGAVDASAAGVNLALSVVGIIGIPGDFQPDGVVDAQDIDLLAAASPDTVPPGDPKFDLNGDGVIDYQASAIGVISTDSDVLIRDILGTEYGDANLSGTVTLADFTGLMNYLGMENTGWAGYDFDASGRVGLEDFNTVINHLGMPAFSVSAGASAVPEPASGGLLVIGSVALLGGIRRRRTARAGRPVTG